MSVLISSGTKCNTCVFRWLKYITEAGDVYKDTNPLKTPPQKKKVKKSAKPAMSDVPEACET